MFLPIAKHGCWLRAKLKIVHRHCHSFRVVKYPPNLSDPPVICRAQSMRTKKKKNIPIS